MRKLVGVSNEELAGYAEAAKNRGLSGKWVLPLQNTTQQPALRSLQVRSTREKLFEFPGRDASIKAMLKNLEINKKE